MSDFAQSYNVSLTAKAQAAVHGGSYLICVFTKDWQAEADVMATRDTLRRLGVIEPLNYKRNAETFAGVYGTPDEFFFKDVL